MLHCSPFTSNPLTNEISAGDDVQPNPNVGLREAPAAFRNRRQLLQDTSRLHDPGDGEVPEGPVRVDDSGRGHVRLDQSARRERRVRDADDQGPEEDDHLRAGTRFHVGSHRSVQLHQGLVQ